MHSRFRLYLLVRHSSYHSSLNPAMRACLPLRRTLSALAVCALAVCALACPPLHAAQQITLRNGAEFLCTHQEQSGDRIRLYLFSTTRAAASDSDSDDPSYIEVPTASVLSVETVPDPPAPPAPAPSLTPGTPSRSAGWEKQPTQLTPAEMHQLLARAGQAHNIDADLLASVIHAESGGNVLAVSRAGARGLMQLMPATAATLGVRNAFAPGENISGGTAYLDQLLTRYRDNLALALAAYNAGPEAVDRYRGVPPYAETRAYVARVIREFNRRKLAANATTSHTIQTASVN